MHLFDRDDPDVAAGWQALERTASHAPQQGTVGRAGVDVSQEPTSATAVVDETFTHRLKTLLRTEPLHQLAQSGRNRDGDWSPFDLVALALATFDAVIARMGFDAGASIPEIVEVVAPLADAAVDDGHVPDGRTVARVVLDHLLNADAKLQPYRLDYADYDGPAQLRRQFEVRYLTVEQDPHGDRPRVRATQEAINLLVGALETRLEDERAALMTVLDRQMNRGEFGRATTTARRALLRTVQYVEDIRDRLGDVRRNIRAVDWREDVAPLLEEAIGHLDERIDDDSRQHALCDDYLDATADPEHRGSIIELQSVLEEDRRRSRELLARLQDAGATFREEQARQLLAPPPTLARIALDSAVMQPLLQTSRRDAAPVLETFVGAVNGASQPRLLTLRALVGGLLEPRHEPGSTSLPDEAPDLIYDAADEAWRYSVAIRREADQVMADIPADGRRLSQLVTDCLALGDLDLADLVVIRAARAFAADQHDTSAVTAQRDGKSLDTPRWGGDDLILHPAGSTADETNEISDD